MSESFILWKKEKKKEKPLVELWIQLERGHCTNVQREERLNTSRGRKKKLKNNSECKKKIQKYTRFHVFSDTYLRFGLSEIRRRDEYRSCQARPRDLYPGSVLAIEWCSRRGRAASVRSRGFNHAAWLCGFPHDCSRTSQKPYQIERWGGAGGRWKMAPGEEKFPRLHFDSVS